MSALSLLIASHSRSMLKKLLLWEMLKKFLTRRLAILLVPASLVGCCTQPLPETPAERLAYQNAPVIRVLNELIQLDIDTYYAYGQAIGGVKESYIQNILEAFRRDHELHIRTLSTHVLQLGGLPIPFSRGVQGALMTGYTALRKTTGTQGALEAMQTAERASNQLYENASLIDMPDTIKADVRKNLEDERRHLASINRLLSERKGKSVKGR